MIARWFVVRAKVQRGVIKEMDRLYLGFGHHLEEEATVAIDGQIHETAYFQPIRPDCEVFFIPKLGADSARNSKALRPPPRSVDHREYPQSLIEHAIDDDIGRAGDDELASPIDPSRAAKIGVIGKP